MDPGKVFNGRANIGILRRLYATNAAPIMPILFAHHYRLPNAKGAGEITVIFKTFLPYGMH